MNPRLLALEVRRMVRSPRFLLFTVAFPVIFFAVFAGLYHGDAPDGTPAKAYLMTEMAVFGGMGATINAGARIAVERQVGWNRLLRLTPLAPRAYVLTKLVTALVVAVPGIALVFATGLFAEGVHLEPGQWARMGVTFVVGLLPFAVLGAALGYVATGDSAQSMTGGVLMLLALFGGVWFPVESMPRLMAAVAHGLPSYWLGIMARAPLTGQHAGGGGLAVMLAWTVGLGLFVARRYRRDTAR
jgi:ABC-2 type transport system permease protein